MDLDDLLVHYFGAADPAGVEPARLGAGLEQLAVDFGVERDEGRRFALWALMEAFGIAPPPAEAFKNATMKRAAEDYLSAAWRLGKG